MRDRWWGPRGRDGTLSLGLSRCSNGDHGELRPTAGTHHYDEVADALFQQGATYRRAPRDVPLVEIDLVFAHDAVRGEGPVLVLDVDVGAKVDDRSRPRLGLDHGDALEPFGEPVNAAIDLA